MNKSYTIVWNESKGCWNVAGESAKQRGKSSCSGVRAGAIAAVVLGLAALMPSAHALPVGGTVTHGSASFWSNGPDMTINQNTPKAVIKWDEFGVNPGERLTFNQQPTDMALNYVAGGTQTVINGALTANGKIFVVNPQGIVFNASANVNVGGLVASTLAVDPAAFFNNTNDEFVFEGTSGSMVENNGALISAHGGDVLLLGHKVFNRGVIQTHGGTTALGAGSKFTVGMGSGLVKLEINGAALNALAQNSGTIRADSGQVLLKARTTSTSPLMAVVNNSGVIEARTLNNVPGKIVLDGGSRGTVEVAGKLSATALTSYGNGGSVEASGERVRVRLDSGIDTRATNGVIGTFRLTSNGVNVESIAAAAEPTIHADTLNRNLASTNIELNSSAGDVVVNAPLNWNSSNSLTLNAQHGGGGNTILNAAVSAAGAGSTLDLRADERIDVSDRIVLSGLRSHLALTTTTTAAPGKPAIANYVLKNAKANITLSGAGTTFLSNNIYHTVIQDQAGLQAINNNPNGLYVLGTDLRGTGKFQSIGGPYGTFNGVLDGMGHTLIGFTVTNDGGNVGLFSSSAGVIRNLNLASMDVTSPNNNVAFMSIGALAGLNTGLIDNVNVTDTIVRGNHYRTNVTGGLVGTNSGGIISNSAFSGTVISGGYTQSMGGLVGTNQKVGSVVGSILNSQASGMVNGATQRGDLGGVGGLVGTNNKGHIQDSKSAVMVAANAAAQNVGGGVGLNFQGTLHNVSSTGAVSATSSSNVGGLVGSNNGTITLSASSGPVEASKDSSVGGLVGVNNGGFISASEASGKVTSWSAWNTGGLVGANNGGHLEDVKARGIVEERQYAANIGGLVGYNGAGGLIQHGEASGETVSGGGEIRSRIGGLVGTNNGNISYSISRVGTVRTGDYAAAGGLAGSNYGLIQSSRSTSLARGGQYSVVGGLVGINTGEISGGVATGSVVGQSYSTIAGLVAQNQIGGEILHSTSTGLVTARHPDSPAHYGTGMIMGGLVGINHGTADYSSTSSQVDFGTGFGQTFGGLVGINYGTMQGNTVLEQASQVPVAGSDFGLITMAN